MFRTTAPFAFFDYLRIPYAVDPSLDSSDVTDAGLALATTGADAHGPALLWPSDPAVRGVGPIAFHWDGMRMFGSLLPPDAPRLAGLTGEWSATEQVHDEAGKVVSAIWRDGSGRVLLPFDPRELMEACWTEGYRRHGATSRRLLRAAALRAYYTVRPAIPRSMQIRMRQVFARAQGRASFPRWPAEPSLHDLYHRLYELSCRVAGSEVPWIGFWPGSAAWAIVLTHDVETAAGRDSVGPIVELEAQAGFTSSWNVVPGRYEVDDALVASLVERGCEIGLHGLMHDGRDLASRRHLLRRLPRMRAEAARIGAVGFRSPATQRSAELMPLLGFDYDSSFPDTDPYEPQAGGCATWLPYRMEELVELPITLPQDHTLFVILRHADERIWIEKVDLLRRRGGMALVLTHPDYLSQPAIWEAYRGLLAHLAPDTTAWRALPREVSAWWRARDASRVVAGPGGWSILGPAAGEGSVRLKPPG